MVKPVERHSAPSKVGLPLKPVGRPLEGYLTIGAVTVAVAYQPGHPEQKIQYVERHDEHRRLLPQVHRLMPYVARSHRSVVVEDNREQRDGVESSRWKPPGMYHPRHSVPVFGSSSCVGDTIIRPCCEEGVNEGDELGIILILDS